jgi:hypothetical protein
MEKIMIDYQRVFTGLPEIMGMPMKMAYGKWYASRKIDGSYSTRPDKLVCRYVDSNGIQVLEQGGERMSLFQWMIKYGGCKNGFEAKMRLIERGAGYLPMPECKSENIETRYVIQSHVDLSIESRLQTPDNLTKFLFGKFNKTNVDMTLRRYKVGVGRRLIDRKYLNMTQFWYIDSQNRNLHDKLMYYNVDGHRDHNIHPNRAFKKTKGFNGRCLFGEHLLPSHESENQVYIVESEKTALICSIYYGRGLWLACGGKNNLQSCGVKDGWKILPDVDAYSTWKKAFGSAVIPWWDSYEGVDVGEKWDIGDLIVERLIKK